VGPPVFKLCSRSSAPFAGVCDLGRLGATARHRLQSSAGVAVATAVGRPPGSRPPGKITLLNVLERQQSGRRGSYRSGVLTLFTARVLQYRVEVGVDDNRIGMVGAEGSLGDLEGPLVLDASGAQVPQPAQHQAEVVVQGGHAGWLGPRVV
jgi:hypothetical protein